ncbi:MAG: MbeB family mobilization protein [Bacteroidota bacterium]
MNNSSKLLGAFALGAVATIAVIKLMESDKGKEFMESAKEKANSTAEDIKAKIQQLENELADLIHAKGNSPGDTV